MIPNLNRIRALPDAAPSWRWVAQMPNLRNIAGSDLLTQALGEASGTFIGEIANELTGLAGEAVSQVGRSVINFLDLNGGFLDVAYTEAAQMPFPEVQAEARFQAGKNNYYPGFNTVSSVSFSFYEDEDYHASKYFEYWHRLIVHKDCTYGYPADYKKQIGVFCYNYINSETPVFRGYLLGCWPTTRQSWNLTYTESNRIIVTVTFSVDSYDMQIVPQPIPSLSFFTGGGNAFSRFARSGSANALLGGLL